MLKETHGDHQIQILHFLIIFSNLKKEHNLGKIQERITKLDMYEN